MEIKYATADIVNEMIMILNNNINTLSSKLKPKPKNTIFPEYHSNITNIDKKNINRKIKYLRTLSKKLLAFNIKK